MSTLPDDSCQPASKSNLPTLYSAVFEALPIPVTLIDPQGLILDVNQAFLDYANTFYPQKALSKTDRVGQPLASFAKNPHTRTLLEHFVDRLFTHCVADFLEHEADNLFTGKTLYVEIEGIPLQDATGQIIGAALLRRDLTDSTEASLRFKQRRQALQTVRDSVWQMRSVDDNYLLIEALFKALPQVDMPLQDCSINAVDTSGPQPVVRFYDTNARSWEKGTEEKGSDIVLNFWRGGAPVYRRDLAVHDSYNERNHIQIISNAPVRSVVDIPFSQGTLAVSSTLPNAFSDSDITFLQEMAVVIDEGFSRLRDLGNLAEEARTAEALAEAIAAVADTHELDEVLQKVVEGAAKVLSSTHVTLFLWHEEDQVLKPRAQIGYNWDPLRRIRLRPGEGLSGRVFTSGKSSLVSAESSEVILDKFAAENRAEFIEAIQGDISQEAVVVPLSLGKQIIGTLAVARQNAPYAQRDSDLLQRLGEQAVLAVDRTQREAELKASEARYRTLFEQSPEAIAVHAEGKHLFVNEAAAKTLGAESPDQLIGLPVFDIIHPDYHQLIEERRAALLAGQPVQMTELKLIRLDGRIIDAQSSVSAVTYQGQHAVQSIFRDITEHKLAEEQLKVDLALQQARNEVLQMQSEADWEKVVSRCHEGLHQFVSFHQCGFTLIDLGQDTYDSYAVNTDGLVKKYSFTNIPPSLRQVVATAKPVYRRNREEISQHQDNIGEIAGCVVDVPFLGGTLALNSAAENAFTERDISLLEQFAQVMSEAYRRLEDLQRLARQEEALVQSQKMEAIGQLAGGIAHDFNNMLTAILTASEFMLTDRDTDHSENQDLNLIKQAGEQAAMLTRQLLAFGRRQYLQPKVVDLNGIVTDTQRMLGRLIGEHITQQTALDAKISRVRVDPGQIEQVLFNLAINARDAMPDGGQLTVQTGNVELTATTDDVPPGTYVTLRISDTGVGMDDKTQTRIFEPFFTTKELGRGTGMGLATVYGIVQQSGGHIQVSSTLGTGTSFAIYLPQAEGEVETELESRPQQEMAAGSETILLVEDEDMVRSVTSAALIRCGYQVLEAQDGNEALRILAQHQGPLDMVLTDVVMPGMGGEELVRHLLAERPDLQVLFMSGYLREARLRDRPFLPKPFTPEILSRKVRQTLDA